MMTSGAITRTGKRKATLSFTRSARQLLKLKQMCGAAYNSGRAQLFGNKYINLQVAEKYVFNLERVR